MGKHEQYQSTRVEKIIKAQYPINGVPESVAEAIEELKRAEEQMKRARGSLCDALRGSDACNRTDYGKKCWQIISTGESDE